MDETHMTTHLYHELIRDAIFIEDVGVQHRFHNVCCYFWWRAVPVVYICPNKALCCKFPVE